MVDPLKKVLLSIMNTVAPHVMCPVACAFCPTEGLFDFQHPTGFQFSFLNPQGGGRESSGFSTSPSSCVELSQNPAELSGQNGETLSKRSFLTVSKGDQILTHAHLLRKFC